MHVLVKPVARRGSASHLLGRAPRAALWGHNHAMSLALYQPDRKQVPNPALGQHYTDLLDNTTLKKMIAKNKRWAVHDRSLTHGLRLNGYLWNSLVPEGASDTKRA